VKLEDETGNHSEIMKNVVTALSMVLLIYVFSSSAEGFEVGERVLARWTNNLYYTGKVTSIGNYNIHVLFDDGDEMTYNVQDVSGVIRNSKIPHVYIGQHVLANWHGGVKYYIGYVSAKAPNNQYTVTFDDNDEASYLAGQLTEFPYVNSAQEEGARVFARWTNGLYYRGFVTSVSSTTVGVKYDDGDTITLPKHDLEAVILDALVCYTDVHVGQRVIGFWPGQTRYYPGTVESKVHTGSVECFQNQVYNVAFDDGDKRKENFYQIRLVP